jgi:hypothetical protein
MKCLKFAMIPRNYIIRGLYIIHNSYKNKTKKLVACKENTDNLFLFSFSYDDLRSLPRVAEIERCMFVFISFASH